MKILPFCKISRQAVANKIAKRNTKNIEEYTRICADLPKEVDRFARDYASKIARIGKRNRCRIEFAKGENLFAQTPMLNIYKKELHIYGNREVPIPFEIDTKKMQAALPDLADIKGAIKYIQKLAGKVHRENINLIKDHRIYRGKDFFGI